MTPDGLPAEGAVTVLSLFGVLEGHLADAALGLSLFEQALAAHLRAVEGERRAWEEHAEATSALMNTPEVRVAEGAVRRAVLAGRITSQEASRARDDLLDTVDLQARRQQWAAGQLPFAYSQRLLHIHAHSVLYALAGIHKALRVLAQISGLPAGVAAAYQAHAAALPDLTAVRNSAQHIEDRARGVGPGNRVITLRPVTNQAIYAPDGNVLIMGVLSGNRLGYTAADGSYREVEVSAATVRVARDAIQEALDAITWQGFGRTVPR